MMRTTLVTKNKVNFVVNLSKRRKKAFFTKLGQEPHKKSFWNACKSVFPGNSGNHQDKIMLEPITGALFLMTNRLQWLLNNYFVNIVQNSINITPWSAQFPSCSTDTLSSCEIENIISKYREHPSKLISKRIFKALLYLILSMLPRKKL